ncbi:MAG: hypothetical protein AAGJ10_16220 [Bacteroidota bacterium]
MLQRSRFIRSVSILKDACAFQVVAESGRTAARSVSRNAAFCCTLAALAFILLAPSARAQTLDGDLRVLQRTDGVAYVYHTALFPLGYSYTVYRGPDADNLQALTASPQVPVQDGLGFVQAVSPEAYASAQDAVRADEGTTPDPFEVLISLRSDPIARAFLGFQHAELATALGQLYIDSTATPGVTVTYRFAEVDPFGKETGRFVEDAITLSPTEPAAPTAFEAAVRASDGIPEVRWRYPATDADDGVLYFDLVSLPTPASDAQAEEAIRLNRKPILRNAAAEAYQYLLPAVAEGDTLYLALEAVDVAQQRARTPVVTFVVPDETAPEPPTNVFAEAIGVGAEVLWFPSVSLDVVGYHVYRATQLGPDAEPQRLTDSLLVADQFSYFGLNDEAAPDGPQVYFYTVRAVDAAGNESVPSPSATVRIEDLLPPPAPTQLEAAIDTSAAATVVRLTWAIGVEQASDFQTFILRRQAIGQSSGPRLHQDDLTALAYADAGPFVEGETYRYLIASMDATRNVSAEAVIAVTIPDRTPPSPPETLTAEAEQDGRIRLRWQPSTALDAAGQEVYRTDADTTLLLATLPSTRTVYEDPTAATGIAYTYAVRAVDERQNRSTAATIAITRPDRQAPRYVRNVRAQAQVGGGVRVAWEPVPDADVAGYRVYRSAVRNGTFALVTDALLTDLTFDDAGGSARVFYQVRAVDASGNESRPSDTAQAREVRP